MREFTQIDSSAEHECSAPSPVIERWNVLEPISGQWSWLVIYACCGRVAVEPEVDEQAEDIQQAA